MNQLPLFSGIFILMLIASTLLQWSLAIIQIKHIAAHKDKVPEFFATRITLAQHQKAADYSIAKLRFSQIEMVFSAVIVWLWTLGGGLQWLDQSLSAIDWHPVYQGIAFILVFAVLNALLDLPFGYYRAFVIEQKFGFNRMTHTLYVSDLFKQFLLLLLVGTPILWVILQLMALAGSYWWLYAWLVWFGFSLLMMWAYPAFIAPLFNKFQPLEDEALKNRIEALLARCGFTSSGIFVMDGSRRSSHGNAYFTGMGNNKRIVFYDNLLQSLNAEEIEAVLAHELGHFKHKHILKRLLLMALMSLAGFALLGYLLQQSWFFQGLGVSQPSDYMALVLFSLITSVFLFPFAPLTSFWSRKHEFEADRYAASQANAQKLIDALVKLYKENYATLTPSPLYSAWYDSHPPAMIRIQHLQQSGSKA